MALIPTTLQNMDADRQGQFISNYDIRRFRNIPGDLQHPMVKGPRKITDHDTLISTQKLSDVRVGIEAFHALLFPLGLPGDLSDPCPIDPEEELAIGQIWASMSRVQRDLRIYWQPGHSYAAYEKIGYFTFSDIAKNLSKTFISKASELYVENLSNVNVNNDNGRRIKWVINAYCWTKLNTDCE